MGYQVIEPIRIFLLVTDPSGQQVDRMLSVAAHFGVSYRACELMDRCLTLFVPKIGNGFAVALSDRYL